MVGSNPQLALICLTLLNLVMSFNSAIIKDADKSAIPNMETILLKFFVCLASSINRFFTSSFCSVISIMILDNCFKLLTSSEFSLTPG